MWSSLQCRHRSCYWLLKYSCYIPSRTLTLPPFSSGFRRFQAVQNGIKTSELSEHESGQVKIGINKRKNPRLTFIKKSFYSRKKLYAILIFNLNHMIPLRSIGLSFRHVLNSEGLSGCKVFYEWENPLENQRELTVPWIR